MNISILFLRGGEVGCVTNAWFFFISSFFIFIEKLHELFAEMQKNVVRFNNQPNFFFVANRLSLNEL